MSAASSNVVPVRMTGIGLSRRLMVTGLLFWQRLIGPSTDLNGLFHRRLLPRAQHEHSSAGDPSNAASRSGGQISVPRCPGCTATQRVFSTPLAQEEAAAVSASMGCEFCLLTSVRPPARSAVVSEHTHRLLSMAGRRFNGRERLPLLSDALPRRRETPARKAVFETCTVQC
jgi:hypothetical protein